MGRTTSVLVDQTKRKLNIPSWQFKELPGLVVGVVVVVVVVAANDLTKIRFCKIKKNGNYEF